MKDKHGPDARLPGATFIGISYCCFMLECHGDSVTERSTQAEQTPRTKDKHIQSEINK